MCKCNMPNLRRTDIRLANGGFTPGYHCSACGHWWAKDDTANVADAEEQPFYTRSR